MTSSRPRFFAARFYRLTLFLVLVAVLIAWLLPPRYQVEAQFFVPLTIAEQQAEQSGVGFGGNAEIDAHIQLLRAPSFAKFLARKDPNCAFELEVRRTRYGAVSLALKGRDPEALARLANLGVSLGDSLKEALMRGNRYQSLTFLRDSYQKKNREVRDLQAQLDSLRRAALGQSRADSLDLLALTFRMETLYGTAVNELARYRQGMRRAEINLDAPAPKAYLFSPAQVPRRPEAPHTWHWPLLALGISIFIEAAFFLLWRPVASA